MSHNDTVSVRHTLYTFWTDFRSQLGRLSEDAGVVKSVIDGLLTKGLVNDRGYTLERTIQWASSYPEDSPARQLLTTKMLGYLWDNLKHPPLSYMGDGWRYRTADGSHNNILYPDLGKAGSYYARSVVPEKHLTILPDPGDIFDELFARRGPAKEHPTKFSSLAIALATIIIHDIFRTDDKDHNKVASSSYLDLGPLYGHNQNMQDKIRLFEDGKIKPDTFAEPRILGMPPGVGALLIAFNRFHNYAVEQLAVINEGGRFRPGKTDAERMKRDNDLFQTGRLITCGLYIQIILHDYVRVILNLARADTTWNLDPRDTFFDPFNADGVPKGIGNQVSLEFNLIYRWHATVSDKNDQWTRGFMAELWPGRDPTTLTADEFVKGVMKWAHSLPDDPVEWEWNHMQRINGRYNDADLVGILADTTEDLAGAFGARNVPTAFRVIEILGIEQGRSWGTASLNETRKFFRLQPHATFKDINPDPEIAASLEALYQHPDNVELYPGLVCEDTKPPMVPGSGLCAGLTVAKAILSDAVALVRGDRYYTVDNSPANLTAFGFNEIASRQEVGFGTTIYKLLIRAFPGWYRHNSVYALFPLTIPPENRHILQSKGIEADYVYERPKYIPQPQAVLSWHESVHILEDQSNFKTSWAARMRELSCRDWMLSGGSQDNTTQRQSCMRLLDDGGSDEILRLCDKVTTQLIAEHSIRRRDEWQIDAVRHVSILSHATIMAQIWGIDTPAKELYEAAAAVFHYVYLDLDAANTAAVRSAAVKGIAHLERLVSTACRNKANRTCLSTKRGLNLPSFGAKFVKTMLAAGQTMDEVVWTIVSILATVIPFQCQGIVRLLDFYLSPERCKEWTAIQQLSQTDSPVALEQLRKYTLEGLRLSSPSAGVLRAVTGSDRRRDSVVFVDFNTAGVAPILENAQEFSLERPDEHDSHLSYGPYSSLGRKVMGGALAIQLRAFGRLKNLRRAPGPPGQLKQTVINGACTMYMNEDWTNWAPFPSSWALQYDG